MKGGGDRERWVHHRFTTDFTTKAATRPVAGRRWCKCGGVGAGVEVRRGGWGGAGAGGALQQQGRHWNTGGSGGDRGLLKVPRKNAILPGKINYPLIGPLTKRHPPVADCALGVPLVFGPRYFLV